MSNQPLPAPPPDPVIKEIPPAGEPEGVTPLPITPADVVEMGGGSALPPWAERAVPPGFVWPTDGRRVTFLRFAADRCHDRTAGDHTAIVWPLSVRDEKQAKARMRVTEDDSYDELTKQMIRAHDGVSTDWARPIGLPAFWDAIGPKHRNMLVNWYVRTHLMTNEERVDFFANCVAFRSVT